MNRDHFIELMSRRIEDFSDLPDAPDPENFDIGMPAEVITTTVDVRDYIGHKRRAMAAHASQITGESFFLQMPDDAFLAPFGPAWYSRRGPDRAAIEDTLFPAS
jgi:LmbE family N-acetylglucosaminyl deacetylase